MTGGTSLERRLYGADGRAGELGYQKMREASAARMRELYDRREAAIDYLIELGEADRCPPGCPRCAADYLDAKQTT